jgi:hypothetical protein
MKVQAIKTGLSWDDSYVMCDGEFLSPERSQIVWNHSPDGFAWGYGGSGPSQLALAILLEAGISENEAVRLHQEFKREFIETQPQEDGWTLDVDVEGWALAR